MGNYKWKILALLFLATTINYVDRNVLSFVMLDDEFKRFLLGVDVLDDAARAQFKVWMGYVDSAFKLAYIVGFLLAGWFIDRVGVKKGLAACMAVWSVGALAHTFIGGLRGLIGARAVLGVGEAGIFPASVKTVAEWFPKRERSFATGIFNAGTNMGIILTALAVPPIVLGWGWRGAFLLTGALGFVMLVLWWLFYRKNEVPWADEEAQTGERIPWGKLLTYRQTWTCAAAKFFTDQIWWFYLVWLPTFFNENQRFTEKLDLKSVGLPFLVIYLVSDVGSVFFGWLATHFIKKGWSVPKARKFTMLLCALCVVPISLAATTTSIWLAIGLIALAAAAHQGWSANAYTLASDLFPQKAIGSVVGIAGMFGAVGGMILAALSGVVISRVGYLPLFLWAASAYLVGLAVVHLLAGRFERAVV
ncbi:MAG: MFS transporter [Saprospiraceae bacterium]|nr:MFS transporter [Saprospiraceae bacterium]